MCSNSRERSLSTYRSDGLAGIEQVVRQLPRAVRKETRRHMAEMEKIVVVGEGALIANSVVHRDTVDLTLTTLVETGQLMAAVAPTGFVSEEELLDTAQGRQAFIQDMHLLNRTITAGILGVVQQAQHSRRY